MAQEWAPPGASFAFIEYDSVTTDSLIVFYYVSEDSFLLEGRYWRKIEKPFSSIPEFFTLEKNDSVYIRGLDPGDDSVYLWMDFSAAQGDTLVLGAPIRSHFSEESYRVVVDHLDTILVGDPRGWNITTRRFALTPLDGYTFFPKNRYVEVIGSTENLIPFSPQEAPFKSSEFSCYFGDLFSVSVNYYQPTCFSWFNKSADLLDVSTVNFFPNPFHDILVMESLEKLDAPQFVILDALGKRIQSGPIQYPQTELQLADLSPGTYWIQITSGEKTGTWKLVKPR